MPWPKGRKQPAEMVAKRKATMSDPEVRARISEKKKGATLSEEHKARISEGLRGRPMSEASRKALEKHWGAPRSEETRRKLSEISKARWKDPAYREKQTAARRKPRPYRVGLTMSNEMRRKLSESHKGIGRTVASRLKQSASIGGHRHYNYKGGPLPGNHRGPGWHTIKTIVRDRAGGKCEFCGGVNVRGWKLDVHHVIPYREIPVTLEDGCLALCRSCHMKAERGVIDTTALKDAVRALLAHLRP